jgi:hypothetical protein
VVLIQMMEIGGCSEACTRRIRHCTLSALSAHDIVSLACFTLLLALLIGVELSFTLKGRQTRNTNSALCNIDVKAPLERA